MATATYTPTTSGTDLKELWRKVQVGVVEAFGFGVEEWNLLQKLKNFQSRAGGLQPCFFEITAFQWANTVNEPVNV